METTGAHTQYVVTNAYDERARQYGNIDAVLDAGAGARVNKYYDYISKQWVFKYLHPQPQDTVLDFGCGLGRLTEFLSPKVKYITGLDASAEMIKLAQSKNIPNTTLYHIDKNIPAIGNIVFDKLLFHWVLIHLDDDAIHSYLTQLEPYILSTTLCYMFEQTNIRQRTTPTNIHIHRTKEEYIKIFEAHGWTCRFTTRVWRIPSYGMGYWNKYTFIPDLALPLLAYIDKATLYRKPEYIEYTTEAFVFNRA